MSKKPERKWEYTRDDIELYVATPKEPTGEVPNWTVSPRGNPAHQTRSMNLRLCNTVFQPAGQKFTARGVEKEVESFVSVLILEDERIRSIDFTPVKQRYLLSPSKARDRGWHENQLYYDPKSDLIVNDHVRDDFEYFAPTDLQSFFEFSCNRWNIRFSENERRLL